MGSRADRWDQPKRTYLERVREETGVALELEGRGARWASGAAGTIGLMASASRDGERWWLGLDENEFQKRHPLGLVLLCQSQDRLLDFGFPYERVLKLLPRLGRDRSRGERKFNLTCRRNRYWLQIPGEDGVEVTDALGDVSWLRALGAAPRVRAARRTPDTGEPADELDSGRAFFARVKHGLLEPLDPMELPEGALVKIRATLADSVPKVSALRIILAGGGPAGLPADFAERHDHYAHGARD